MSRLGRLADDPDRFREDRFNEARVLADLGGQRDSLGGRGDGGEIDDPAFRLGDDLLGEHEHIAVLRREPAGDQTVGEQSGEIVAGPDQGKVGQRGEVVDVLGIWRPGQWGAHPAARRGDRHLRPPAVRTSAPGWPGLLPGHRS